MVNPCISVHHNTHNTTHMINTIHSNQRKRNEAAQLNNQQSATLPTTDSPSLLTHKSPQRPHKRSRPDKHRLCTSSQTRHQGPQQPLMPLQAEKGLHKFENKRAHRKLHGTQSKKKRLQRRISRQLSKQGCNRYNTRTQASSNARQDASAQHCSIVFLPFPEVCLIFFFRKFFTPQSVLVLKRTSL
jgi:hypothetical protein